MEIEGEDGSKILIKPNCKTVFGRGTGFDTKNRIVSRRHVLFELENPVHSAETQPELRVSFQVLGKNPVWVRRKRNGEIKIFKKFDKGEATPGDSLCFFGKTPVCFTLKRCENEPENGERRSVSEEESGLSSVDISGIDPVKEFGFVVMGKEFDRYPKQRIRDVKHWDWFLEETKGDSDDDERRKGARKKKRKNEENGDDDDDWRGESDDVEGLSGKARRVSRPVYSTRSKAKNKRIEDTKNPPVGRRGSDAEEDDETEDDDTLGGFIVGDDDVEMEKAISSYDEEEEEEEENDE